MNTNKINAGTNVALVCTQPSYTGHGKVLKDTRGIVTDSLNGYCRVKFYHNGNHIDSIYVKNEDLKIEGDKNEENQNQC